MPRLWGGERREKYLERIAIGIHADVQTYKYRRFDVAEAGRVLYFQRRTGAADQWTTIGRVGAFFFEMQNNIMGESVEAAIGTVPASAADLMPSGGFAKGENPIIIDARKGVA